MKRKIVSLAGIAVVLAAALLSACSQKQVRTEGVEGAPRVEAPAPGAVEGLRAPATPGEAVLGAPADRPAGPVETPPAGTAATEPGPRGAPRGGLPSDTTPGLARIHFEFDRSTLSAEARAALQANAAYLKSRPGTRVRVEGHTDERGTSEYNLALGERRAKSAYQYLVDLGIDPRRLDVVSYGEEVPLDPRGNEEAWAANRRAEFIELD
jgi:peptidoglycan-associated lipoprotein